jgi:hypothetical protein
MLQPTRSDIFCNIFTADLLDKPSKQVQLRKRVES